MIPLHSEWTLQLQYENNVINKLTRAYVSQFYSPFRELQKSLLQQIIVDEMIPKVKRILKTWSSTLYMLAYTCKCEELFRCILQ